MGASLTWKDVIELPGFSSALTRSALNRAVATMPRANILEVGSYKGSTTVGMCFGNDVACVHCVDNHSEFGDTRAELLDVCQRFSIPATIHDFDYFAPLNNDVFGGITFNVYLYDGPHEEHLHAQELSIAWPHLSRQFLYIVDDFSWPHVRRGCEAGLALLADKITVKSRHVYESTRLNDEGGYWNGLFVAWCEKT